MGFISSVTQPLLYPAAHWLSKLRTYSKKHNKEKSVSLLSRCHFHQHTKQCLATKKNKRLSIPPPPISCITRVEYFCLASRVKLQIYESFTWIVQNWFWFSLSIWTSVMTANLQDMGGKLSLWSRTSIPGWKSGLIDYQLRSSSYGPDANGPFVPPEV